MTATHHVPKPAAVSRIELPLPQQAVFEAISDPRTYPHWLAGAKSIRSIEAHWPAEGSSFDHVVGAGPIKLSDRTTVIECERPHLLRLEMRVRPLMRGTVTFQLQDAATNGSRPVTRLEVFETTTSPAMTVLRPVMAPLLKVRNDASLRRLAEILQRRTAGVRPPSPLGDQSDAAADGDDGGLGNGLEDGRARAGYPAEPLSRRVVNAIERSHRGNAIIDAVHGRVRSATSGTAAEDLLSGRQLGHPAHPALVQLPIGCFLSAGLLDAFGGRGGRPFAQRLIGLGLATSAPAVASGAVEWTWTRGPERRVGAVHAAANLTAWTLYLRSYRRRRVGRGGMLSSVAAATALSAGAWLGGHLAYGRRVGVNQAGDALPEGWTEVSGELPEAVGAATPCRVGDVPVLVTRQWPEPGAVTILDARCTHRGGPLEEGAIERECVTCPWHGSRFDLRTGDVRRGPASVPQARLDVQVIAGRLHARGGEAVD